MSLRTRPSALPVPATDWRSRIPISRVPQPREDRMTATWRLARPARIAGALALSQTQNSGGWFVAGASGDVGRTESVARTIAGREVVFWRNASGELVAGPGACPHLGALMDRCPVMEGTMYCRWHGLAFSERGDTTWSPYAALDDGVLLWVRLPTAGEEPTAAPSLPERPPLTASVAAVISEPGLCEPQDVIANRLDPWHGSWFHPYAFSHLVVDDAASDESKLVVDVTFRLSRTWGVPVRAEFTCPDTRTITMQITEGEGAGSVVETHATPLGVDAEGRPLTMITEATIAYSDRPGFRVARWMSPLLKPGIKRTAKRLWVDDLDYAERRYALRRRGEFPG
ncbi:MAG: Rieske (2Fe-2S) protein [Friedmanniella sp.]|nr:Rieske (2Fe-2S) protein [Friedmanniella sp.]